MRREAGSPKILVSGILVPRAHDPSGLWRGSTALAGPDFLSMCRAFVSYSRPIRFDGKSVNRGLPVLDQARALDLCRRPERSWALGTRMGLWKLIIPELRVLVLTKRHVGSGNEIDCLQIMVCSYVVPSKRVLLPIIFCSCLIETTFSIEKWQIASPSCQGVIKL